MKMLNRTGRVGAVASVVTVLLLAAGCSGSGGGDGDSKPTGDGVGGDPTTQLGDPDDAKAGGTLKAGVASLVLSAGLDPTSEYTGAGWTLLQTMTRTLVTYKYAGGNEGRTIVADLATEVPEPTDDGRTYTFRLKDGVEFGPPLSRPITSRDIAYAFQRINDKRLVAPYAYYYTDVVEGLTGTGDSAQPIAGIETPDDQTIIFRLTEPTGDFLARLTMWATAPIPEEVGSCFNESGTYGRNVVSSGAYMIEGSDQVDASSCATLRAAAGFDPTRGITLVRNPGYDAATDPDSGRMNYADTIEVQVNTNVGDIYSQIESGSLDVNYWDAAPKAVLARYAASPDLKDRVASPSYAGGSSLLQMNLTVPPFDDVHVRRAVNWAIDKSAVQKAFGGPRGGRIATHLIPPEILGESEDADFDLFPTDNLAGDMAKAREEMKQSRYDSDGDGVCDDPVCEDVLWIASKTAPFTEMEPVITDGLAELGIGVTTRPMDLGAAFAAIGDPSAKIGLQTGVYWGFDYPDAFTYYKLMFSSAAIRPGGASNFSLVGLSEDKAAEVGADYPDGGVPNIDSQIAQCQKAQGSTRDACWTALDREVMADIVPMVPLMWFNNPTVVSDRVTVATFATQHFMALENIAIN